MFKTRLLSGIILVIAALFLVIIGGDLLLVSTLAISWIALFELYRIFHIEKALPGILGYLAAAAYYVNLRFSLVEDQMMFVMASLLIPNTAPSRCWRHFSAYFMWRLCFRLYTRPA